MSKRSLGFSFLFIAVSSISVSFCIFVKKLGQKFVRPFCKSVGWTRPFVATLAVSFLFIAVSSISVSFCIFVKKLEQKFVRPFCSVGWNRPFEAALAGDERLQSFNMMWKGNSNFPT
jgi:hypothetical protein